MLPILRPPIDKIAQWIRPLQLTPWSEVRDSAGTPAIPPGGRLRALPTGTAPWGHPLDRDAPEPLLLSDQGQYRVWLMPHCRGADPNTSTNRREIARA